MNSHLLTHRDNTTESSSVTRTRDHLARKTARGNCLSSLDIIRGSQLKLLRQLLLLMMIFVCNRVRKEIIIIRISQLERIGRRKKLLYRREYKTNNHYKMSYKAV